MRNDKVAVSNMPGAELDDIEIECPGAPAFGSLTSLGTLDRLTRFEQGVWLESGLEQHHLVQVRRLLFATEGGGFLDRGCREQACSWKSGESIARILKVRCTISQITA